MKKLCHKILLLTLAIAWNASAAVENPIRLNTVGFLPDMRKAATIATACTNFQLIRVSDGGTVFTGQMTGPKWNEATAENLFTADFSAWREPGAFALAVDGIGKSAPFVIGTGAFTNAFQTAMLGMYLWRCGTAVSAAFDGKLFAHAACHTNDAFLDFAGGKHVRKFANGGWHDAGDYNKYVVNAGVSVGVMLRAWEDFGGALQRVRLQLPAEKTAIPDFLREVKWELDWLLEMQADDGGVYHMVSARGFDRFEMPEYETVPRYFSSWSTASTAVSAAMLAQAARDYQKFEAEFSSRCLAAAKRNYAFLAQHPQRQATDKHPFTTGIYQINSETARLWAAVELWESTGETNYLADFENAARKLNPKLYPNFDYGDYRDLAMLTYLDSRRAGRDAALVATVKEYLLREADSIVAESEADGYARPQGKKMYWGSNGTVARQTVLLRAAEAVSPKPEYRETALAAVDYLLGRNCFGRSFVTGIGFEPPLHPHDRLSASLKLGIPCPGRLVGGPQPNPKDWADTQEDFTRNEIAINWNTALIYALAEFLPGAAIKPSVRGVASNSQ